MDAKPKPFTIINSVAPIRICDIGGWTDTWFAGHGRVFNIGVYPYAEVQIAVYDRKERKDGILIKAENYGQRYVVDPENHSSEHGWLQHPLLEASIEIMQLPQDLAYEVNIYSEAPAGASTGTSASVSVALIGGLDSLTPGRMTPHQVALRAQRVETELLGGQCGIQDQLCAAFGGINYIEMYHYPHASLSQIQIPNEVWWELERRLVLIYLGRSHASSEVHEMVIRSMEDTGPESPQLNDLRKTAPKARDAIYKGDFPALGKSMIENTEYQGRLHPELISDDAQKVIEIAQSYNALGWKLNGAGGEGGSLSLLCGEHSETKRAMIKAIESENSLYKHIPTYLSRYGLRVWKQKH